MPKVVLKDCFIEVDAIDFSNHVSQVEVTMEKEAVDAKAFGATGDSMHGLANDRFVLTFQQNFDAASVDATLHPIYNLEEEVIVKVRPTSAVVSATNPQYSGTCKLFNYQPLNGNVGALSTTQVTLPAQGSGISRAIA